MKHTSLRMRPSARATTQGARAGTLRPASILTTLLTLTTLAGCAHLVPDATPPSVASNDKPDVFRAPPIDTALSQAANGNRRAVSNLATGTVTSASASASGTPSRVSDAAGSGAPWWHRLGQAGLGATVDEALADNPGLDATEQQLAAARHLVQAAVRNAVLPSVDVGASAERIRAPGIPSIASSPNGTSGNVTLQNPGATFYDNWSTFVRATYDVDLFGASRLDNETRRKQVDVEAAQRDAARLSLAARVATTTMTVSALQAQWVVAERTAALSEAERDSVQRRAALGAIDEDRVLSARAQAASAQASLAALTAQRETARHALAALLGRTPDAAPQPLPFDPLRAPGETAANAQTTPIPTVVPSTLLAQRPDIRAATAALQGSAAAVGVARAAMLPSLQLTAALGRGGFLQPALLSGPAWIWAAAAQLTAPVFHGGALREQVKASQAAFAASKAQYRQTVLHAFQQVSDQLSALEADQARITALRTRWESARRSADRQQERAALGAVSPSDVRAAEQQALASERDLIDARATQWQDLISLYEAIGVTAP
jgi:NodT family efflux transporter outer membrane factor (OMF) lipoprotein